MMTTAAFLKAFSLCFALICPCFLHHAAAAEKNGAVNDMKSLLAFKRSITHDPHLVLQDWHPNSTNACMWTGIQCSSSRRYWGRVVFVDLDNRELEGSISLHIGNLSMLRYFSLLNNSFSGLIPPQLGRLSKLQALRLSYNTLRGPIPPQLGNLSSLQYLFLSANALNGTIPDTLGKLFSLQSLLLYGNFLTGPIPESLHELRSLRILKLHLNQLTGPVPVSLGELTKLELLYLHSNKLHGRIPEQLGNLSSLQDIDLSFNSFQGNFPSCLFNATSLTDLWLAENKFEGKVPPSIGGLNKLQNLVLFKNSFNGRIPESMANFTSLTFLDLNFNEMQGPLPAWVSSFPKLQRLLLAVNNFSGVIPSSWANLTLLQQLELGNNSLQGNIPNWLGNLVQLRRLVLGNNDFTSTRTSSDQSLTIFKALFNCTRLEVLNIPNTYLLGILPWDIGFHWPSIQRISLYGNTIYGRVPSSIGNLSSLFDLILMNNYLNGGIPSQMGNMGSIQEINLAYNNLKGNIPSELALANRTLTYLRLQGNFFLGRIPSSISKLQNLRSLNLGMNSFSGKIPAEIGECVLLEYLDLSANNLSGEIPVQVTSLKNIVIGFNLSKNFLTGNVTAEIGGMQKALSIDLSSNHLSGNIGIYIAEWLSAVDLNLSFNRFSGNLSEKIGNKLTQLQSMDLSNNCFTGMVPESLTHLSYLRFLNLSYNNFEGQVRCAKGAFKNLSKLSFLGNPLLCGCFGLNDCKVSKHPISHGRTRIILKVLLISIISLCGVLLLCLLLWFLRRKKKGSKSIFLVAFKFERPFLKLSMEELQRATNNFSPTNLIGQGRFGKVYYGELGQRERLAIKVFSPSSENSSEKSFKKECQILGKLRHRNLIKILTVAYFDGFKAIVMPYMENGSLHSLLQNGENRLCLEIRLRILKELASALNYLHRYCKPPVLHCDINPQNVLLDGEMTVKLSDFGIAHMMATSHPQQTSATSSSSCGVQGTVGYIAPEYGTGGEMSTKGDVYSFGVVMLVVMTRIEPTHEMFGPPLTLPNWVSMVFQGNTEEEKEDRVKRILTTADETGGGIEVHKEKDLDAVQGVFRVALLCTGENAVLRPSMEEVESALSTIYASYTSSSSTFEIENQARFPYNNLDEVVKKVETQPRFNKYGKEEIREVYTSTD